MLDRASLSRALTLHSGLVVTMRILLCATAHCHGQFGHSLEAGELLMKCDLDRPDRPAPLL